MKRQQEIRILGQLAALLDADPRHSAEVIVEFFLLNEIEKAGFLREYEAAQQWRRRSRDGSLVQ